MIIFRDYIFLSLQILVLIISSNFIYTKIIFLFYYNLDPLDPLTEIVRTGQAFSPLIFIERLIWLIIGVFFIGAMTTGIKNGRKDQGLFSKSFFPIFNKKIDKKNSSISNEGKKNVSKS